MKIRALSQFPIAPDGIRTRMLEPGAMLDVPAELGSGLVLAGLAEEVAPERSAVENKAAEPDDDNPFLDDEPEVEGEAEKPKPARGRPRRENKDAGARSRRS